jgi:hypothetical protein
MKEDNTHIKQIAVRASSMFRRWGILVDPAYIESELKIVHEEICRLRLEELMDADEGNFAHDVAGIHRHLDILDGSFREGFSPRFAA